MTLRTKYRLAWLCLIVWTAAIAILCSAAAGEVPATMSGWRGAGTTVGSLQQRAPADTSAASYPAVCRIRWTGDDGGATGVLVAVSGDVGLVATAAHVAKQLPCVNGICPAAFVQFPGLADISVRDARVDKNGWDLGMLVIDRPSVAPLEVASQAPAQGDSVTMAGYGDGRFWARSVRVKGFARPERSRPDLPYQELVVDGRARAGDSGGLMLDGDGRVAGIIAASDYRSETVGPCCRVLRDFLERVKQRVAGWRQRPKPQPPMVPIPKPTPEPGSIIITPEVDLSPDPPVVPKPESKPDLPESITPEPDPLIPRLDALEGSLAALGDRLDNAPPPADPTQTIRDTVRPMLAGSAAGLVSRATPWALGLLGLSAATPAGWAVLAGLGLLRRRWKRKRKTRAELPQLPVPSPPPVAPPATSTGAPGVSGDVFQRDFSEVQQLLRLSELEGRSPLGDAIIGRFAQDELATLTETNAGKPEGDWARQLHRKLIDRFNQVAPLAAHAQA